MAGFSTSTPNLTRTSLWSAQFKDVFLPQMYATRYVDWIKDFPDGTTLNIPSVGLLEVKDYAEGQPIQFTAMDTGNWQFTIEKYKSVGTYIYDKFKHDSFYSSRLISEFAPAMHRAFAVSMETDFLATGPLGQTADDLNTINTADHRFIGSGTNETIAVKDFHLANYALDMASVPRENRIAIVDPSVEFALATMTNLVNVSFNPSWEGIVRNGMSNGMNFFMNIFGWDVYISQYLRKNTATETIDGKTTAVGAANNIFFSAASDALPIKGLVRQSPTIEFFRNINLQRDEYVATCYYDYKLFRPENFVTIVTDVDQVA